MQTTLQQRLENYNNTRQFLHSLNALIVAVWHDFAFATSKSIIWWLPLSDLVNSFNVLWFLLDKIRLLFLLAKFFASAAPMPVLAPIIQIVLFLKFCINLT